MDTLAAASPETLPVDLWLSLGLPLGIALIGLAGTLSVLLVQLHARKIEIRADRDDRAEEARALAIEGIVDAIAEHARVLGDEIARYKKLNADPATRITYPSNFDVKRALSRLTTRAHERRLTDASYEFLRHAMKLSLADQPMVYGILQERLEFWLTGERSLETTLQIMAADAAGFAQGKLPETTEPL